MIKHSMHTVFLGIDVHKKTFSITAIAEKTVIKRSTMPADPKILLAFIRNNFPGATVYSAYEAGFSGFGLHRFLVKNDVINIVVHPASIEVAANNKVKNDKRDSTKIAEHLSNGKLRCVHIPSIQREAWRSVTRLRSTFVKERSRTSSRIKDFLFHFGLLDHKHSGRASKKWINSLFTLKEINEDVFYCLKEYLELWLYFDKKIAEINKRLKKQAKKDFKVGNVYKNMSGLGFTSTRILANELGDLSQFRSERALYSFTGLTPRERSSGEKRQLGNISHQGRPIIRAILTEAAWIAIRKDEHYKEVFDRLVRNTGSRKKAILGIGRRMIGQIRAQFKEVLQEEELLCVK